MKFDANEYNKEYKRDKYDSILIRIPKGKKEALKQWAKTNNISLNVLFVEAAERLTGLNLSDG